MSSFFNPLPMPAIVEPEKQNMTETQPDPDPPAVAEACPFTVMALFNQMGALSVDAAKALALMLDSGNIPPIIDQFIGKYVREARVMLELFMIFRSFSVTSLESEIATAKAAAAAK